MKNDQIKDRSMLNEIVQPLTDWSVSYTHLTLPTT